MGGRPAPPRSGRAPTASRTWDTAWFVGVTPINNPRYVVAIVVEEGGSGGRVAAPTGAKVLRALLGENPGEIAAGEDAGLMDVPLRPPLALDRAPNTRADVFLILPVVALSALGAIMIFSASAPRLESLGETPSSILVRQLLFIAAGFVVFAAASVANERSIRAAAPYMYFAAVLLLVAVLTPIGGHPSGRSTLDRPRVHSDPAVRVRQACDHCRPCCVAGAGPGPATHLEPHPAGISPGERSRHPHRASA